MTTDELLLEIGRRYLNAADQRNMLLSTQERLGGSNYREGRALVAPIQYLTAQIDCYNWIKENLKKLEALPQPNQTQDNPGQINV